MNKTTEAQRDQRDAFAAKHIQLNAYGAGVNVAEVRAALVREFAMSRDSALGCIARAARRMRHAAQRGG